MSKITSSRAKIFDPKEVKPNRILRVRNALDDIAEEIKKAPLKNSFDVKGPVPFDDGEILRVKTLKLFDKGVLILSRDPIGGGMRVIAAEEIIIDNPKVRCVITRPVGPTFDRYVAAQLKGRDGTKGKAGAHGRGTDQHGRGYDGQSGGEGTAGNSGGTAMLPTVLFFAQNIRLGTGTTPEHEYVSFFLDGPKGGNGGRGGEGGNGGNGAKGSDGSESVVGCVHPGKNGGDGGYGGMPGRGGRAGMGVRGASIYFVGPTAVIDMMKFFSVRQEGGPAGDPGGPGKSGTGGVGGRGGDRTFWCGDGSPGADRTNLSLPRPDTGFGGENVAGRRGDQSYFTRDNSDLF